MPFRIGHNGSIVVQPSSRFLGALHERVGMTKLYLRTASMRGNDKAYLEKRFLLFFEFGPLFFGEALFYDFGLLKSVFEDCVFGILGSHRDGREQNSLCRAIAIRD